MSSMLTGKGLILTGLGSKFIGLGSKLISESNLKMHICEFRDISDLKVTLHLGHFE
jgi:hypothetical protein